ncbi:MAG: hypothetical protein VZR54_08795 [Ruminococcus sp.]|nr:hypothetical protein [Ruminococcus sp.]
MDITQLTTVVGSVGFPAVMCLLMYKYMTDTQAKTDETLKNLETAIKSLEKGVDTLVNITIKKEGEHDED